MSLTARSSPVRNNTKLRFSNLFHHQTLFGLERNSKTETGGGGGDGSIKNQIHCLHTEKMSRVMLKHKHTLSDWFLARRCSAKFSGQEKCFAFQHLPGNSLTDWCSNNIWVGSELLVSKWATRLERQLGKVSSKMYHRTRNREATNTWLPRNTVWQTVPQKA